jgi:hypothetical protein
VFAERTPHLGPLLTQKALIKFELGSALLAFNDHDCPPIPLIPTFYFRT